MATKEDSISFSLNIEKMAQDRRISYMDAIIEYSETNNVEIEIIAKHVSSALKSKIKLEAEALNLLPKSNTAKLW